MSTRKILYSPGYGAGWVSWEPDPDVKKLMLTYQPIIDALERGEELSEEHPAAKQLVADVKAMGKNAPYLGGIEDLKIAEVNGPVRIEEYDGYESYRTTYDDWL